MCICLMLRLIYLFPTYVLQPLVQQFKRPKDYTYVCYFEDLTVYIHDMTFAKLSPYQFLIFGNIVSVGSLLMCDISDSIYIECLTSNMI